MSGAMLGFMCTFQRDGVVCGRYEEDSSIHVREDERMRRGAHVWRHDPKDRARLAEIKEPPLSIAEAKARHDVVLALDAVPPNRRAHVFAGALAMLDEDEPAR